MLPDIAPDMELGLMQEGDPPGRFLARAAAVLAEALGHVDPALAIVQGDTATAYAGALAAFRLGIPIAHVEAGLRTASIAEPFPEELFRRAIARLATLHFAPTARARDNLLAEGVASGAVHLTGNTGIDRLMSALEDPRPSRASHPLDSGACSRRAVPPRQRPAGYTPFRADGPRARQSAGRRRGERRCPSHRQHRHRPADERAGRP